MRYCAFLRGVNVNGTSMKMAEVCDVFSKEGMKEVTSVLASGNILFSTELTNSEAKEILEKAMSVHFNYEAFLFIKSKDETEVMLKNCPFEEKDELHTYIFVATRETEKILEEEFSKSKKEENERAAVVGNTFYWQVPKGNTLGSEFGKILGKKILKPHITSRNINTFRKILVKL